MFFSHQNNRLHELFSHKPYQGADPATAAFLFFGLDANYDPNIADKTCFSEVVSYLEDGVRYWKQRDFHHPFRHPDYKGDGAFYHRRFAKIGFTKEHAEQVSFVELIDVPTYGRSKLTRDDLNPFHIARLSDWVLKGRAAYIFMPSSVNRLLRKTPEFSWLPEHPIGREGSLPVLFRSDHKVAFSPYHFSYYGNKDIELQLQDIGKLIR